MTRNSSQNLNNQVNECHSSLCCCLFASKQPNQNLSSNNDKVNRGTNEAVVELQATLGFARAETSSNNSPPMQISMNVSANISTNKSSIIPNPNPIPQVFVSELFNEKTR